MTHSVAQITARLLVALGETWTVRVSMEPSTPDNVITVYDTAGRYNGRSAFAMHDHYTIQVRVRAADYPTGWAKADALRTMLAGVVHRTVTIDSKTYDVCAYSRINTPLSLGREGTSERFIFVVNCSAAVREV